eukprot:2507588-Amphidinium_carterae.1
MMLPRKRKLDASTVSDTSETSSGSSDDEGRPRLSLPSAIAGLFTAQHDDPGLHQGRQRKVPHVDGNYATFVYLPVETGDEWQRCAVACASALEALVSQASTAGVAAKEVHIIGCEQAPGWHVSMAPSLSLRKQFNRPLLASMEKLVNQVEISCNALIFEPTIEIFAADSRDRYFAGVTVSASSGRTCLDLADKVTECMESLGLKQQCLHSSSSTRRFHCSLAWTLTDLSATCGGIEGVQECTSPWGCSWVLPSSFKQNELAQTSGLFAPVHSLNVKIGDRVHNFPFQK